MYKCIINIKYGVTRQVMLINMKILDIGQYTYYMEYYTSL